MKAVKDMTPIERAKAEVKEERDKKAVEALKVLYREKADAEDIVASIARKIAVEEAKLTDNG